MEGWTFQDALGLIQAIERPVRKFGYQVALGGSVLLTGKSKRDVDLYFITLDQVGTNLDGLMAYFKELWGAPTGMPSSAAGGLLNQRVLYPHDPPADAPRFFGERYQVDFSTLEVAENEYRAELEDRGVEHEPEIRARWAEWLLMQEQYFLKELYGGRPPANPLPKFKSPYARRFRYHRGAGDDSDRIDVFVLGGDQREDEKPSVSKDLGLDDLRKEYYGVGNNWAQANVPQAVVQQEPIQGRMRIQAQDPMRVVQVFNEPLRDFNDIFVPGEDPDDNIDPEPMDDDDE